MVQIPLQSWVTLIVAALVDQPVVGQTAPCWTTHPRQALAGLGPSVARSVYTSFLLLLPPVDWQPSLLCLLFVVVQGVFSEPVDVDTAWVPVVHPKSEADRESIRGVIPRNILFASLDSEQVRQKR
jgi:hypothetical protein